ncbi:unnamed protein product [Urochloa humidicola]
MKDSRSIPEQKYRLIFWCSSTKRSVPSRRTELEIGKFSRLQLLVIYVLTPLLMNSQAQDSPDLSLFSYPIGDFLGEGKEVSSAEASAAPLSDEVKDKLRAMLPLLDQEVEVLVRDVNLIRQLYQQIKGELPADVESVLIPAAFIESH